MSITRIKISGITRLDDAALAAKHGADFIGLNLVRGPRRLTAERAAQIYWGLEYDNAIPLIDIKVLVDIDREYPNQPWHGWVQDFPYKADVHQVYTEDYR